MDTKNEILAAANTAFIDFEYASSAALRPKFVSNDSTQGRKVVSQLDEELARCESFEMSVAFITMGGIEPLLMRFRELEAKGVQGKILTTDYLAFSDPKALSKLNSFSNIEIRMYKSEENNTGFHTKGYIFHYSDGTHKALVGSSNLTSAAISENKEWNVIFSSLTRGELLLEIQHEFNSLWEASLALDSVLSTYEEMYKQKQDILRSQKIVSIEDARLEPNGMQLFFIEQFEQAIKNHEHKGLLVSATGTGKTYASAFAVRDLSPKRALFLVHREQVLRTSMQSYKRVFGSTKTLGLFAGNTHEADEDIVFASIQTISKDEYLHQFDPDDFELIIIDEVHRAGAKSYQKILNYFDADFYFGMTATPDRPDGFDIYELFDHNILYEIRLQKALEDNLLCPFHYFGISDLEIEGKLPDDESSSRDFQRLTSDERVKHVLKQTEFYGYSGTRVKGLMFCSTKNEAKELSRKFNESGLMTYALTGEDSQETREEIVRRLVMKEEDPRFEFEHLDYVLTVDIFNEGIDIPEINQIVMLRPTQSPIVFVQQLGRGLRKTNDKEFVVVLDFIGNYSNNFMIPIALSGDRSYNKDSIRRYVMEGTRVLPGSSSIHFDSVSREQIFSSIDRAKTGRPFLRAKYTELKNKLGRVPSLCDFERLGEIDPQLFIKNQKSYYRFLADFEPDAPNFNEQQHKVLEFISRYLTDGIRLHELLILKEISKNNSVNFENLNEELERYEADPLDIDTYSSCKALLNKGFYSSSTWRGYDDISFVNLGSKQDDQIFVSDNLNNLLANSQFRDAYDDVIEYGILRYQNIYAQNRGKLKRYAKYTRSQVCRALNWSADEGSTIFGYKTKHDTCPIFVTYKKAETISDSAKDEDHFINGQLVSWMTRSNRSLDSDEVQKIIHAQEKGIEIHLFVKKSDDEGTDFYYMGQAFVQESTQTTISTEKGNLPIVNICFRLDQPVRDDIYSYFTE